MQTRVFTILTALAILIPCLARADVPTVVNYQGLLLDPNGAPVNGTVQMVLRLFDQEPVGMGTPFWTETHPGVQVVDGVYNILFGSITSFDTVAPGGPDYWMEVQVNGEVLDPRQRITSVLFAFQASEAELATVAETADDADTVDGSHAADLEESAEIDSDIATHASAADAHHTKTTSFTDLTDAASDVQIPPGIARDSELDWGNLSGIPAGFLDGEDNDTLYFPGVGLDLAGTQFAVEVPLALGGSAPLGVVRGTDVGGSYGYLGKSDRGVHGYSAVASGVGVEGLNGISGNAGTLGSETTGAFGSNAGGNYGYLGGASHAVYGNSASDYAGYFDGSTRVVGELSVLGSITGTAVGDGSGFEADLVDDMHASEIIAAATDEVRTAISACPTTINSSGSYYLPGNLTATGTCITVDADNVTIDLMGFSIVGPGKTSGTNNGIYMSGRSNIEIRNGTVREFGAEGILDDGLVAMSKRVIDMRVLDNGGAGISFHVLTSDFLVRDCTVSNNDGDGIAVGYAAVVTGNIVYQNGGSGIRAFEGSTVTGNTARDNTLSGIDLDNASVAIANSVLSNNGHGIECNLGCTIKDNAVRGNGQDGIHVFGNTLVDGNTAAGNSLLGSYYDLFCQFPTGCVLGVNLILTQSF